MCGIAGRINMDKSKVRRDEIKNMLNVLKHRGPNGSEIYINENIGLGHVLLKIQDLSDNSIQPYKFKNYVLAFNGEIYNYVQLKEDLEERGYRFKTCGDTEILVKYIHCYGIDKTLQDIEGCYAIALYDEDEETTYLIRDRFGIKPLHYYNDDRKIVFASEVKSILQDKTIERIFDLETIAIAFNCKLWMDPRKTFFKNIYMIEPGHYLKIHNEKIDDVTYYKLDFSNGYENAEKLIQDFSREFEDSVKKKLISKVPIAAFLSGGIDSSIVCKIANDNMENKLNTYTICYNNDNDLDLTFAKELSEKENLEQHNVLIREEMYNIENIDKVIYSVEEILIDKVYISMYFNYKKAKDDGFTVVLSGQGSDEVWLGYIFTWKIFEYIKEKGNIPTLLNDYYLKNMLFSNKLRNDFEQLVVPTMEKYLERNLKLNKEDLLNSYSELSIKTILHDLLMQEDKIAMAHSIESRVPFVDNHRIVELAYKASSQLKLLDGREKYVVREYSKGKITDGIVNRDKYPFPEPPKSYNDRIQNICNENWEEIKKSNILNKVIDFEKISKVDMLLPTEQWMLLSLWRFEKVFNMGE